MVKLFTILLAVTLLVSCSGHSEQSHDDYMKNELLDVIELLGVDCGEVIKYQIIQNLEYVIQCGNQKTYRLSVSPSGTAAVVLHTSEATP